LSTTAEAWLPNGIYEELVEGKIPAQYRYGIPDTEPSENQEPEFKLHSHLKDDDSRNVDMPVERIRQVWSCVVVDDNGEELTARLQDITNPDNPDELVTFDLEEVERRDQPLIEKGAMFFWHIGYRYGPKYPRERFSKISFRRLPKWTKREIEVSRDLAKEYADFFCADSTQPT
jgi:hypothetical protein